MAERLPALFVLGDSILMHYGPYLAQFLAGRFWYSRKGEDPTEPERINSYSDDGNGGDSAAVQSYLAQRLAAAHFAPDILLLNCGLHDLRVTPGTQVFQVALNDYKANLQAVAALLYEAGIRVVWVRTTPVDDAIHNSFDEGFQRFNADVERYNAAADAIAAEAGWAIVDLNTFTSRLRFDELYVDHVHFTETVRKFHGAYLARFITALPLS